MTKERPRETGTRFDDRDHEFITSTISYRTGRQEVLLPIDYSHYSFLEKQMIKLRIIFPRDYKLHLSYRLVQFGFVEKFTSAYYAKLQEKSRYYLLIIYMKNITESQDRRHFESLYAFCNLHPCYNFALVLHQNALVFSQSKARDKIIIQIPRSFVAF